MKPGKHEEGTEEVNMSRVVLTHESADWFWDAAYKHPDGKGAVVEQLIRFGAANGFKVNNKVDVREMQHKDANLKGGK